MLLRMWLLITYSYDFKIRSFYCDLPSLANQAQVRYVSVNTVILSLYTINKVLYVFAAPGF